MKIIEASSQGQLTFVQVMDKGSLVTLCKVGDIRSITTDGRGAVRLAKSMAKSLSKILEGI